MQPIDINLRYAERALLPGSVFPGGVADMTPVRTNDGVLCLAHFLSTWDNGGGRYEEELDRLCQRQWNCSFDFIRTIWRGRVEDTGQIWHYIELKKTEE